MYSIDSIIHLSSSKTIKLLKKSGDTWEAVDIETGELLQISASELPAPVFGVKAKVKRIFKGYTFELNEIVAKTPKNSKYDWMVTTKYGPAQSERECDLVLIEAAPNEQEKPVEKEVVPVEEKSSQLPEPEIEQKDSGFKIGDSVIFHRDRLWKSEIVGKPSKPEHLQYDWIVKHTVGDQYTFTAPCYESEFLNELPEESIEPEEVEPIEPEEIKEILPQKKESVESMDPNRPFQDGDPVSGYILGRNLGYLGTIEKECELQHYDFWIKTPGLDFLIPRKTEHLRHFVEGEIQKPAPVIEEPKPADLEIGDTIRASYPDREVKEAIYKGYITKVTEYEYHTEVVRANPYYEFDHHYILSLKFPKENVEKAGQFCPALQEAFRVGIAPWKRIEEGVEIELDPSEPVTEESPKSLTFGEDSIETGPGQRSEKSKPEEVLEDQISLFGF